MCTYVCACVFVCVVYVCVCAHMRVSIFYILVCTRVYLCIRVYMCVCNCVHFSGSIRVAFTEDLDSCLQSADTLADLKTDKRDD